MKENRNTLPVAQHAQVKPKFVYPAMRVAYIAWDPDSITLNSKLAGWVFNTRLVAKLDQLIRHHGNTSFMSPLGDSFFYSMVHVGCCNASLQ